MAGKHGEAQVEVIEGGKHGEAAAIEVVDGGKHGEAQVEVIEGGKRPKRQITAQDSDLSVGSEGRHVDVNRDRTYKSSKI